MFTFAEGTSALAGGGMWLAVFGALFFLNEISRRNKWTGFVFFFALPVILSILWFTLLRDQTYRDWFHLAKVYSAIAGCIGFWCIRFVKKRDRLTGAVRWRLVDRRWALWFPPLILAINILEAVARDIQVGETYAGGGLMQDSMREVFLLGGPWNYVNAAAGILSIITITGWFGICLRKKTRMDKSQDMLWPDMLWFWVLGYDLWNFAYTYNCLPHHSWYCGFALLLVPTVCAFTMGKGAWLQHRAHTLALWCMFAQTFPAFQDIGRFAVNSTYNPSVYFAVSIAALVANGAVLLYMISRVVKTKRHPYTGELYVGLYEYREIKELAEKRY